MIRINIEKIKKLRNYLDDTCYDTLNQKIRQHQNYFFNPLPNEYDNIQLELLKLKKDKRVLLKLLLLGDKIELRQNNKILLPYLKMQDKDKRCSFLNKENRCMIHSKRPNICRLFPLGRAYQDDDFKYFLQVGNCPKEDLKDVKVKSWIGIENYDENKRFILEWYKFIKALTFRLKFVRDEEEIKAINKTLLEGCYRIKIKEDEDFYSVFLKDLPNIKNSLGII